MRNLRDYSVAQCNLLKKIAKECAETVDISETMCYNSVTFAERSTSMATETKKPLLYKGRPLMRKDNVIYYGSMSDPYIVMMQVLETRKHGDEEVASKVDRKSTRLNSSHSGESRMPSSA